MGYNAQQMWWRCIPSTRYVLFYKQGYVFLFERETGKPLFPIKTQKYPPSDLEGEVKAKEQSLPVLPAPFARQK